MRTALLAFAIAAIVAGIGAVVADEPSQKEQPNKEEESVFREEIADELQAKIEKLLDKIRDEEKVTEGLEERIDEIVAKLGDLSLHHVEYFEDDPGERVEVKLSVDDVAYRELFEIGKKALPRLVVYLSDDSPLQSRTVRRRVIALVQRLAAGPTRRTVRDPLPDNDMIPIFLRSIEDRDEDVRWQSAIALGLFEDESVAPALASMLNDDSRHVKVAVYEGLIRLGKESLVPKQYLEEKKTSGEVE